MWVVDAIGLAAGVGFYALVMIASIGIYILTQQIEKITGIPKVEQL